MCIYRRRANTVVRKTAAVCESAAIEGAVEIFGDVDVFEDAILESECRTIPISGNISIGGVYDNITVCSKAPTDEVSAFTKDLPQYEGCSIIVEFMSVIISMNTDDLYTHGSPFHIENEYPVIRLLGKKNTDRRYSSSSGTSRIC